jgi:hypothetical protein
MQENTAMASFDLLKVEERLDGLLVYNVRMQSGAGRMELPIVVQDQGTSPLNEAAVMRFALGFAEEFAASIRPRLGNAVASPLYR